jgi:hypothetical protein
MPELIRTFTKGKMNKDLDERLVPNGEYRDALNLEISTSDTGNVGSLQNIAGNSNKPYRSFNPDTGQYTLWVGGYIDSMSNPKKIGEIIDSTTEKIYWFLSSNGISAIAEYDQTLDVVTPVIVDTKNILNFSEDYLITGINIIEGLMFFTDGQTEPKVVNIKDFKESSTNFLTHTVFNGRDFEESDITVIKKSPLTPPTLDLSNTRILDDNGEPAVVSTTCVQNFVIQDPDDANERIAAPIGTEFNLSWVSSPYPFYRTGDILVMTGSAPDDANFVDEYEARVEVLTVTAGSSQTGALVKVLAVNESVQDVDIDWDVRIDEKPFFEFKFPRFAYRYKYKDGYYSTFSPFTEVAFLPSEFEYNTKKGYNLGMVNTLRQCIIKDFVPSTTPLDVVEVDLLYKESNSSSIYVVDTFKKDDDIWNANEFNIESEIISSLLPANQILRPYDNVPLTAKAQEITGNRIVYANYEQNFDLKNNLNQIVSPTLTQTIAHYTDWDLDENGDHTLSELGESVPKQPYQSLKTQRTYQIGVVFADKYGRQTPVFTSESAAVTLGKEEADQYNKITVQTDGNKPEGFESFKYYIKENSQQYYNLAMDRWYDAEDGNVWISFPSSERNKVDDETFLELKKRHESDEFIPFSAKYKVIAISNEAPLFLRRVIKSFGTLEAGPGNALFKSTGIPQPDRTWIDVDEAEFKESELASALDTTQRQRLVRILGASNRSDWYEVSSITIPEDGFYRITIDTKFGEDMGFVLDENDNLIGGLLLELASEAFEDKPEFEGRFFIKLYKDSVLEEYILASANIDNYAVKTSVNLGYVNEFLNRSYINTDSQPNGWGGGDYGRSSFFIDDGGPTDRGGAAPAFTVGGNKLSIGFTGIWPKGSDFGVGRSLYRQYRDAVDTLMSVGGLFRFKEDPDQVVYKITKTEEQSRVRNYEGNKRRNKFNKGSNKRTRWFLEVEPVDKAANGTGLFQGPSGWVFPRVSPRSGNHPSSPEIEFLKPYFEDEGFTSDNPGIFETEPKEATELEIYYSASPYYPMSTYGDSHALDWHNCYSFGNGVESDRIRDDFNAVTIDNGAIASAPLKEPYGKERRSNGLIFSQIFNSTSGVNNLNQFIQAEAITKDLNPVYGSIQKLHTRDTNLVTLCEDKCLRILTNKDALFNADGNANVTSNNAVLGQATPYVGEFGISNHPESFASYGFRAYFTDKNRGVVLRLSGDGIEQISRYGMGDFFADNLKKSTITWGSFDDDRGGYNLCLNNLSQEWQNKLTTKTYSETGEGKAWVDIPTTSTVISFKESINAWESRKTFSQEGGVSLNDRYYTFQNGLMWEHRTEDAIRNNFYGVQYDSSVTFLMNEQPNSVKKYKTLNYSGTKSREYLYGDGTHEGLTLAQVEALQLQNLTSETLKNEGWYTEYITTDLQEGYVKQFLDKENKWFQYIKGEATFFNTNTDNNLDSKEFSMQGIGRASIVEGPPISAYNIRVFANPDCASYILPPTANNMTYTVLEDCNQGCAILQLSASDPNS